MIDNKAVEVNESAPEFELPDHAGKTFRLQDHVGNTPIVIYFYPKNHTPGCTAESCSFRDAYEEFQDLGAEVIGISSDSIDSHKDFASKNHLPFRLLSDAEGTVRKLYGVPSTLGIFPGRVTYVIDTNGVVRHIFNSQMNATRHIPEALKVLREMRKDG